MRADALGTDDRASPGAHGAFQSVPPGPPQGLTRWEITLGQLLSEAGYATAHFGKRHLGDRPGRLPNDRGFDEWYGIPRTTDESHFLTSIGFDPGVAEVPHVMRGTRGEPSANVKVYDLEARRAIDSELVEHSIEFMTRQAHAGRAFFLYLPLTQLHFPTLPHTGRLIQSLLPARHSEG